MKVYAGRFLTGSYLQVSLMICFQNIHSQTTSKSSSNCVGQTISLECPKNAIIIISTAMLGYSKSSCQHSEYCMVNANADHMKYLKNECSGQQRCSIKATKGDIKCSDWYFKWSTNFEYVTYNCVIRPGNEQTTPARIGGPESGKNPNGEAEETTSDYEHATPARIGLNESENFPTVRGGEPTSLMDPTTDAAIPSNEDELGRGSEEAEPTYMTKVIVVVTICAILILIAIITPVVILRRQRKKLSVIAVQMSDVRDVKNEEANVNVESKCNKQNPMPPSGNSSCNNSKECDTTKDATHSPPCYEFLSNARHTLGSENPYSDLQSPQIRFKEGGEEILIDNELYAH